MNQHRTPSGSESNDDRVRVVTVFVVCLALVGLAVVGVAEAGKKTTVTISGKVAAAEMRGGKVRTVFVADSEQGEFIVLRGTDVAKQLLKQIGVTIRATGYSGDALREKEFDTYIDILEYEVVAPSPTGTDAAN